MDRIVEKIIRVRKNKGYSQVRFAELLGYSRSYLASVESGQTRPSRRFLESLQKNCGVSIEWLFSDDLIERTIEENKDTDNPELIFVYAFTKEGIEKSEKRLREILSYRKVIYVDASSLKSDRQLYMAILDEEDTMKNLYYKLERFLVTEDVVLVLMNLSKSKISNAGNTVRGIFKMIDDFYISSKFSAAKRWSNVKTLSEFAQGSIIVLDYPSFMEKNMQFGYYAIPIYLLERISGGTQ